MGKRRSNDRDSVSLLATFAVIALGFLGAMFVIAVSGHDPLIPVIACGGVFICIVIAVWLFREPSVGTGDSALRQWFRSRAPDRALPDYTPRRVRTSREEAGENDPPSADEVRDLKDASPNAWVPSTVPKKKSR